MFFLKDDSQLLSESAERRLDDVYHAFQDTFDFRPMPCDEITRPLVTFDDSRESPVHRWFTFKEGYSPRLLPWLLQKGFIEGGVEATLLDPFCGVGTTLVSSQTDAPSESFARATGVEHNPTIFSIAQTKTTWRQVADERLQILLEMVGQVPERTNDYPVPLLSTFTAVRKNGKSAFEYEDLQQLIHVRQWIVSNFPNTLERNFLLLAWTQIIEGCSRTKKDGRALRLLKDKQIPDVIDAWKDQVRLMVEDAETMRRNQPRCETVVMRGDARKLPFQAETFDAICYSPPYLNNIDYTEVYKLEIWLRNDVQNHADFLDLRKGSLRSHPSIKFHSTDLCDNLSPEAWIRRLRTAMINALPREKRHYEQRCLLISNYIDDTILFLQEQKRVAKPGANIVCVIGNSLHGGDQRIAVCSDLIIAASAQAVGLEIVCIQEMRRLPRRDHKNGWLRESVVVLRKSINR